MNEGRQEDECCNLSLMFVLDSYDVICWVESSFIDFVSRFPYLSSRYSRYPPPNSRKSGNQGWALGAIDGKAKADRS